jgi:probable rRNA maturation factor
LKPAPPVAVEIVVLDTAWLEALPRARTIVRRAVRATLAGSGQRLPRAGADVVVALAGDAELRRLNRIHRHKDKPTNVLSYPAGEPPRRGGPLALGDIALARTTVLREARAQGKRPADHLAHLVVHGTLHLLGYDHEGDQDAARMEALEARILAGLGIADPYAG